MHDLIAVVGESIKKKIVGHYAYYGINGNYISLKCFYKYIKYTWYHTLRKRGQKHPIRYLDFLRIWRWLKVPEPRIYVNIW